MVGPDGQEYPNNGQYGIVEAPHRFFFGTVTDSPVMRSGETTVELAAIDERHTRVIVMSRLICIAELIDMAHTGWNGQLDKLTGLLTS